MNMPENMTEKYTLQMGENNVIGNPVAYTGTTDFALEKTLTEVRIQEEMPVKNVTVSEGKTILDFGQNFAGIVEIHPEFLRVRR